MINFRRFWALFWKESYRFLKVYGQTIFSPVITALLYFLVFGSALGSQIKELDGIPYSAFVVPGLMLLQSINNAYLNPSSSLIISKYHHTQSDILMPPLTAVEKTLGFGLSGAVRGFMVAFIIWLIYATWSGDFSIKNPFAFWSIIFLGNLIFSLIGTFWGTLSQTFDQLNGFSVFVLLPMSFLGGTFYNLEILPPLAAKLTLFNPFFYLVDGARNALFGVGDLSMEIIWMVLVLGNIFLLWLVWFSFCRGWGMKS